MIAAPVCPDCGAGLVATDRFCGRCGTGIVHCAHCGGVGLAGDKYCAQCGRDLPTAEPSAGSGQGEHRGTFTWISPWEGIFQRLKAATLGEYDVIREIGRGGMAAVFLAHEIALNRKVAIKVMSPGIMLSEGMVERFRQEAVTVANLAHSNIVTVHAVREVDDLHFFVMEFVAGRALDKVLASSGPLPIPVARAILSQVGSALAYAHRRGVIHRDVKPGNIILDGDGQAIVTDFGIAKVITSPSTTQTGAVHGTAAYMSPEQAYAAPLTPASDQYSLGVVAYELLAGKPPFSGDSSFALMQAHTTFDVPSLIARRSDCPPDLEAAVLCMLAKKPNERWPSVTAALSALQAFPVRPGDPVLDDLVRLADVGEAEGMGEVWRTPVSPVPTVPRRPPPRPPTADRPVERPATEPPVPPPPPVTVPPAPIAALRIAPTNMSPVVGDTLRLSATCTDKEGRRLDRAVSWSTSAPEIGSVSSNGELTLHAPGTLDVIASCESQRDEIRLTVRRRPVARLEIGNVHESITVGETLELIALARDESGAVLEGRNATWMSSDRSVATVSDRGVVTAHNAGGVTISAKCEGKTASFRMMILRAPLATIVISGGETALTPKQRTWLSAAVTDVTGKAVHPKLRWRSSDTRVATVSETGEVTAVRPGNVVITARADDVEGTISLSVKAPVVVPPPPIEVQPPPLDSSTTPANEGMVAGSGTGRPRRRRGPPVWLLGIGTIALVGSGVLLLSGNPDTSPAPVAPALVQPNAAPTIVVSDPPAQVRVGDSFVLAADVRGDTGTATGATRWRSMTPAAGVDSLSGQVSALATGRAVVIAVNGAVADTAAFDVNPAAVRIPEAPRVASIEIQVPAQSDPVQVGDRVPLRGFAFDSTHRQVRGTALTWSSSDSTVARIDQRTGEVTAVGAGTARITARGESRRGDATLVVRAPTVREIIIAGVDQLETGQSQQFHATTRDSRNNVVSGAPVVWSSTNPAVVQIDAATGRMRAGEAGQATVKATVGSVSATKQVVVTKKPDVVVAEPRSEPPPPPPPTPAELLRAGEARMRATVDEYVAALGARNVDRVRTLYNPATEEDRRNLDRLTELMKTAGLTVVRSSTGTPRIESGQAIVEVSTRLRWRNFVGANTERDVPFRAVFQLNGTEWRLVGCRIVGSPRLT